MKEKGTQNESDKNIISELQKKKYKILKSAALNRQVGPWQEPLTTYLIMSIDNLRESTEKSSRNANRLRKILVWLTLVLAFGSIIGVVATLKLI